MTRWVWNAAKANANLRKHGVSFALAVRAIEDPFAWSQPDPHPDGNRWQTIGMPEAGSHVVLFVVHTGAVELNGEEIGRIISVRQASRTERKTYEEG